MGYNIFNYFKIKKASILSKSIRIKVFTSFPRFFLYLIIDYFFVLYSFDISIEIQDKKPHVWKINFIKKTYKYFISNPTKVEH